ncbi:MULTISPECIES: hypothetical protein [unclassified Mesorhizobium]|uniref:hypothetical protein n=1 Tax=unclassified Mesorhizobium TaxID=325217 RepID=UPI001CCFED93|nr:MULTISPECIES: hypothetical protein [unclassified Mesorhizobium]MBZ9740407.1 hypothetical protein [Mesorhizobium sp. CO1-1-4]MBZ9800400.1 hypothetical protein [Mesorhizobium sp. ES1-6]
MIMCRPGIEKGSIGFDFFRRSRYPLPEKARRPSPALIIETAASAPCADRVIFRGGDKKRRINAKGRPKPPFPALVLHHAAGLRSVDDDVVAMMTVMVMMMAIDPPVIRVVRVILVVEVVVVMMMAMHAMSRRRLNGAGERTGRDDDGDEAGNENALEHNDLLYL